MEKRYTALRIIATLYKIVGVIMGVLTILGVVFVVIYQPVMDLGFGKPSGGLILLMTIVIGVVVLLAGGLAAIGVFAVGDLVSLLLNIEENTRFSALLMRDRMQPAQPVQPPAPPVQPYMPPPMQQPPTRQTPPPFQQPPTIQLPPPMQQPPTIQVPPPMQQPPTIQVPPPNEQP